MFDKCLFTICLTFTFSIFWYSFFIFKTYFLRFPIVIDHIVFLYSIQIPFSFLLSFFLSCNLLISSPSISYICSPLNNFIVFSRSTSFWTSSLLILPRQTTSETPNSPLSICWSHLKISILSFSSKSINISYNTLPSLRRSCFLILSDI